MKEENLSSVFPNVCNLAAIAQLIPASTADCERVFSALNRIKTPLRNHLSNKIIVQLLFISIEGPCLENFDFNAARLELQLELLL